MRLVVAIGGNALLKRGEVLSAENQQRNMRRAATSLAGIADGNELVLVHGNGPQVGLLALEGEAFKEAPAFPLDVLGAESQGMIGYVIGQVLHNVIPDRRITTLLTQTLVDANDPAFSNPTKPIGPVYSKSEAKSLARERGWTIAEDDIGFRRVVASPRPLDILEYSTIHDLMVSGALVICGGGGGIPVTRDARNQISGVEAVVDKDLTAALLARRLNADRLVILTDVDGVYQDWGEPGQQKIDHATVSALRKTAFAKGSMGPKIDAACNFTDATDNPTMIGSLEEASQVLEGIRGTRITA